MVDIGYKCKKCNKIYHKEKTKLPFYCQKCGEDLIKEKYFYNLTKNYWGDIVETIETNMFGGYDYVKIVLTDNVEKVKIKRKLFGWKLLEG